MLCPTYSKPFFFSSEFINYIKGFVRTRHLSPTVPFSTPAPPRSQYPAPPSRYDLNSRICSLCAACCPRRMVAAVALDASTVLELLSPLAPAYFLPIASVANIGA